MLNPVETVGHKGHLLRSCLGDMVSPNIAFAIGKSDSLHKTHPYLKEALFRSIL